MLHLYAVARTRGGRLEYFVQRDRGHAIGWTSDLDEAWCIERLEWAEIVRTALMHDGNTDVFLHLFRP